MKTRLIYTGILSLLFIFSSSVFAKMGARTSGNNATKVIKDTQKAIRDAREVREAKQAEATVFRITDEVNITQKSRTEIVEFFIKQGVVKDAKEYATLLENNPEIARSALKLKEKISEYKIQAASADFALGFEVSAQRTENLKVITNFYRSMNGVGKKPVNQSRPQKVNILHDLLANAHEIPFWESGPRENALSLISAYSAYKLGETATVKDNQGQNVTVNPMRKKLTESAAFEVALNKVERIFKPEVITARLKEIREMCRV